MRQNTPIGAKTHDHHGHFHHNIVALLEEVRYQLGLILQLGEDNADDQCKHDNLQHFAVGERTDRVFRDDVQQGFRKADRIRRSGDFGGVWICDISRPMPGLISRPMPSATATAIIVVKM